MRGAQRRIVKVAVAVAAVALLAAACVPTPSTEPHRFSPHTLRIWPQTIDAFRYDGPGDPCDNGPRDPISKIALYLTYWFQPTDIGIYNCRLIAGTNTWSAHGSWRAVDLHFNAFVAEELSRGNALVMNLLAGDQAGNTNAIARRMGIEQIIWNHGIWTSDRPQDGFRPLTGGGNPHTDHVHVQINKAAKVGYITFLGNWNVRSYVVPGCGNWCVSWVPISYFASSPYGE